MSDGTKSIWSVLLLFYILVWIPYLVFIGEFRVEALWNLELWIFLIIFTIGIAALMGFVNWIDKTSRDDPYALDPVPG
jgi:hypothetical protein